MSTASYQNYFELQAHPFSIAPDPKYLYMSEQHREALAHLVYGLRSGGGFVLLTGEVGTGKTTVCRRLLSLIDGNVRVALIYNPKLSVRGLLSTICTEFGIEHPANSGTRWLVHNLNCYLLKAHADGLNPVLIIDEAQNLRSDVLEQLRLLTNLETNERKLLQVVLLGQPELRQLLDRPELRQLSQRVFTRFHLRPLAAKEVGAYVRHRLQVAGAPRSLAFPPAVIRRLHRLSGGVPRVINLLCDRALLGTSVLGRDSVDLKTLMQAAQDLFGDRMKRDRVKRWSATAVLATACLSSAVALAFTYGQHPPPAAQATAPIAKTAAKPAASVPAAQPAAASSPTATPAATAVAPVPPVAAITAPDPTPAPSLERWPGLQTLENSEALAFKALYSRWNVMQLDGALPCNQAAGALLRCLHRQGGLKDLRALDVPAVLHLRSSSNWRFHAAVIAISDQTVVLQIGDVKQALPVSQLEGRWGGDYTVLWEPPAGFDANVRPGQHSRAIPSLRRQLAAAQSRPAENEAGSRLDAQLAGRLKAFQVSEGMKPDGIFGAEVWLALARRTGLRQPTLSSAPLSKTNPPS